MEKNREKKKKKKKAPQRSKESGKRRDEKMEVGEGLSSSPMLTHYCNAPLTIANDVTYYLRFSVT